MKTLLVGHIDRSKGQSVVRQSTYWLGRQMCKECIKVSMYFEEEREILEFVSMSPT